MKNIIIVISLSFCTFLLSSSINSKHPTESRSYKPYLLTTLDSLQGNWMSSEDSADLVSINGRIWHSSYVNPSSTISIWESSMMYFSDTLVKSESFSLSQIDTSKKNGSYIILYTASDNTAFCMELTNIKWNKSDTFFVVHPAEYWTTRSIKHYVRR